MPSVKGERSRRRLLIATVFVLGAVLRVWGWPHTPVGLNQDELSSGYEAWSLLTTGSDRWGSRWPAYFASWGTGQNVLYSYLSIPFIAIGGLTAAALRAVQLIAGIFMVALAYPIGERARAGAGVWTMLVIAVTPWSVMLSRWALESNLLPFTIMLGLFTLGLALGRRTFVIPFALLPFALALYAYGIAVVPLAVFLLLVITSRLRRLVEAPWRWACATAVFLVSAAPFALVLVKTYIVRSALPFEQLLPFSLPDQNGDRLAQVSHGFPLLANLAFVANGFDDHLIWNSLPDWSPVSSALVAVATAETAISVMIAVRAKRASRLTLVDCLALASLSLFVVIPFNVNQGNLVALAVCLAAGKGVARILAHVRTHWTSRFAVVAASLLIIPGLLAFASYVSPAYAQATTTPGASFEPGFKTAIRRAATLSPQDFVYASPSSNGTYVRTLWYLKVPAEQFQSSRATFQDNDFGRFVFSTDRLSGVRRFAFVIREGEAVPCPAPQQQVTDLGYVSGICDRVAP